MSRTILLADDSLTIQKVVELTFADTDYKVVAVSSGDELLNRLAESQPDVIICDVIMPGRDGYDVCHEIKSKPETLHLPVILLTGTFEPFDRDRALAVGCSEIITKPFEARKLVEAVNRLTTAEHDAPLAASAAAPEDDEIVEGQVTPPPPIVVPEDLSDFENELEDTAVSAEFGPGLDESFGEEETAPAEPETAEPEMTAHDTVDFSAPEQGVDFDLVDDYQAPEIEMPEVQAVVAPPTFETETEDVVDTAATVADQNISEMMDSPSAEVFTNPTLESDGDVFATAPGPDEIFPSQEPDQEPPPVSEIDTERTKTTPINVSAVMSEVPVHDEVTEFEFDAATEENPEAQTQEVDDISDADTQDFDEIPAAGTMDEISNAETQEMIDSQETTAIPIVETISDLSDADVDRIARRVLELSGDRIEHIAWDVIPDMAEIVVRERVRELEAESGNEPS